MITSTGKSFTYNTEGTHTLKVGVKGANSVTNIQTYNYTITNNIPTDITIYVRADKEPLYLYAWDANGTLTSAWPGTQLTEMKSANGVNFYYMTFPKPAEGYTLNYILNQGGDDTKSADNTNIGSTIFTALGEAGQKATDLRTIYSGATISDPVAYKDVTVYVDANRYPLNLYAWYVSNENSTSLLGGWPGKQLRHTACINDKTWFYEVIKIQENQLLNLIVSDGINQSANFENVTGDVFVSYDGVNGKALTNKTTDYAGYPQAWYEQGEVCAFFVIPNGWFEDWKNICAYAYNGETKYTNNWEDGIRGDNCTFLGYNENGQQIWKWTCTKNVTGQPATIIFNSASNSKQTEDLSFVNGAWYSAESYSGSGKTDPVSTAVTPSNEINVAALGTPKTATNWNGKSENVAQKNNGGTMEKDFSLAAGDYVVQAIVRGTDGGKVDLSVSCKEGKASVDLTGLDGAASTVQENGIVEEYATGINNGWQKVELPITLAAAEKVTVTLTSEASEWQLGALKVLAGTLAKTKATTDVDLANAYVDVRGTGDFSFFERGANRNALIKAAAGTLPAQLPYNVIVGNTCANLKLTDGEFSFNAGEAFTATNVSYDRTFEQATASTRGTEQYKTSTICLPFSLTATEATEAGTFWGLESFNESTGEINFVQVEAPQANVPYIFEPVKADPFTLLTNKTIPASSSLTDTKDGVSFVGVNTRKHLQSSSNVTYYGYKGGTFVRVGTENGANINPFRAYLQIPKSQSLSRIGVLFDGEYSGETGIQVVKPVAEPKGEQPIYNLSGQRVKTPNQKGIYIKGGKKFVIK